MMKSDGSGGLGIWKLIVLASLVMSIASTVLVAVVAVQVHNDLNPTSTSTAVTLKPISLNGSLVTPPLNFSDAPPILTAQPFGNRLTDINVPLNSTELAVINNAPDFYFETAAQMYLNQSLTLSIGAPVYQAPHFTVNGKPAVVYLGAISCPYCAENRWAMALALSKFGSFQQLFKGYSAIGDGDIPTIYWAPAEYNASAVKGAVEFGNFYTSNYVSFLSIEYSSPITAAFEIQPLSYFEQKATAIANPIYEDATQLLTTLNDYAGTPDTLWGIYSVPGADASDFGDTSWNSTTTLPLASLTQDQILSRLAQPSSPFAWNEYAAADWYIALVCASAAANVSSSPPASAVAAAPVCSLPFISTMVSQAHIS
jgi:hypothetical protein